MKKFCAFFLLFVLSIRADAGLKKFTMHSRANCVNNESISWQRDYSFTLKTVSEHYFNNELQHMLDTGWEYTWRSAAVHWGEGRGGWTVVGYHLQVINGSPILLAKTIVRDCSIYDGWWD